MLQDAGVTSGKVALYGRGEIGSSFALFSELQRLAPAIHIVGYQEYDLLAQAMITKDAREIERIRKMGAITTEVVGRVADYLTSQAVKDGALVDGQGVPVTIADVKSRINLWLAELGAENPEGTIFAIGRDSGVPHSTGNPDDYMRLGRTIVFDIYPCEQGGGYYYDFTRTWCLGHASDEVLALYEDVHSTYTQLFRELELNKPFKHYQKRTCEMFEAKGHPTIDSNRTTESGYVHSLGHGVGLKIHERPFSNMRSLDGDVLAPGAVFTIEPGLYYPEKGMGVRLEDTAWMNPQGKVEILADYPLDLVLPVKGS